MEKYTGLLIVNFTNAGFRKLEKIDKRLRWQGISVLVRQFLFLKSTLDNLTTLLCYIFLTCNVSLQVNLQKLDFWVLCEI